MDSHFLPQLSWPGRIGFSLLNVWIVDKGFFGFLHDFHTIPDGKLFSIIEKQKITPLTPLLQKTVRHKWHTPKQDSAGLCPLTQQLGAYPGFQVTWMSTCLSWIGCLAHCRFASHFTLHDWTHPYAYSLVKRSNYCRSNCSIHYVHIEGRGCNSASKCVHQTQPSKCAQRHCKCIKCFWFFLAIF